MPIISYHENIYIYPSVGPTREIPSYIYNRNYLISMIYNNDIYKYQ